MSDSRVERVRAGAKIASAPTAEIRTEVFRKSIHVLVAAVPALASYNIVMTQILLISAVMLYSVNELLRQNGGGLVFISGITALASRRNDRGTLVLGPVTLALGAMLALMLYPFKAAEIAIYALAFGDAAASLIGKLFGKIVIPGFGKKTVEGSLACFAAVFLAAYAVSRNASASAVIAASATLFELVPVKDVDNLMIPVGTGLVASMLI